MRIIKVRFKLKTKIVLVNLGISFRKLNNKEKKDIIDVFDTYLFNNAEIEKVKKYDLNNNKYSFENYKYWDNLDQISKSIYMTYNLLIKSDFKFMSREEVIDSLNYYIVIESDNNILGEYIDKDKITKFISNLLSLYGVYKNPLHFNEEIRFDYSYILHDDFLNKNREEYYSELLYNFASVYKDKNNDKNYLKYVNLSMKYLNDLKKLTDSFEKKSIRCLVSSIDSMYTECNTIENRIINYTSTIEKLLLSSNEDVNKNFVLKSGIILKRYLKSKTNSSNETLKNLLSFSYNVRSCIVHGNDEKIIDSFKKLTEKEKEIIKLHNNSSKYRDKLLNSYKITQTMLCLTLSAVIKYWFDNPSELHFLKIN